MSSVEHKATRRRVKLHSKGNVFSMRVMVISSALPKQNEDKMDVGVLYDFGLMMPEDG